MFDGPPDEPVTASDRWNRLFDQLSSRHRRLVIVALMRVPEERRLPLPDSLPTRALSVDREELAIQLRHRHLPKLADGEYVRWAENPFCVQRGPRFDHAATLLRLVRAEAGRFPDPLIEGCPVLEEAADRT